MAFVFDHLIAFLVGTTILVALLFVQQRGRQTATETTIRYRAEVQAASFVETVARDLENARTKEQARAALGTYERDSIGGALERAIGLHNAGGQTQWVEFVTLATPDDGAASALLPVAYRLEPVGTQIDVNGAVRDVRRVTRYTYDGASWTAAGASQDAVVGFEVSLPSGASGRIQTLPRSIDVSVEMAYRMPAQRAGDQAETALFGLTRQGATARVYASGTGGRATPPPQGGAPGIPRTPWAPPYVPPPSSGPAPDDPGDGGDSGGGNSGGGPDAPTPTVSRPSGGRAV